MANRLRKRSELLIVPGIQAVPGQAAYCVVSDELVPVTITTQETVAVYPVYQYPPNNNQPIPGTPVQGNIALTGYPQVPSGQAYGVVSKSYTKYKVVPVQTCYPAVEGTAGRAGGSTENQHLGWTSGARSVDYLVEDGQFDFKVIPTPVGVICGFSDGAPERTYDHVSFGFLATSDTVGIVESGVVVLTLASFPTSRTFLAQSPLFSVRRVRGVVTYWVNGAQVYTSKSRSTGLVYGESTLYAAGDYVENPVLEAVAGGAGGGTFRLTGYSADVSNNYAGGFFRLVGEANGHENQYAGGRLPPLSLVAYDAVYAVMTGSVPALTGAAVDTGPAPTTNVAGGTTAPMIGSSLLLVGEIGQVGQTARALFGVAADYPYSFGGGAWPTSGFTSGGYEDLDPPGFVYFPETTYVSDFWLVDSPYVLVAMDTVGFADYATVLLLADAEAMDYVGLASTQSIGGTLSLLAKSGVAVTDQANGGNRTAIQYAVNIVTGALTEYAGYDFTHFARVDGQTYACRPDGLYRLEGQTDDGESIDAMVDMGIEDWNDPHLKTVDQVYLGVTTDGQVFLRVTADEGRERTYRVKGEGNMKRSRLNGKISARQWGLKLELVDATFASVDMVQFLVDVSNRRISGRRK